MSENRKSRQTSVLWQLFKKIGDTAVATCNICKENISFKSTTSNLRSHIRRRHVEAFETYINKKETPTEPRVAVEVHGGTFKEEADEEASTSVWSYYEREAGARARCVVCRAVVPRTDLKTHLKANHPKLVAEVDLGSDEEASDSQEDIYTEIVYLEEEQNAKKQKSTPKQKHKPKPYIERPEPRKRQASSSSDEAPLRRKKTIPDNEQPDNNEEIEQFGKYVTCLLKKIPPAACMELQAEIINLIMKKQLELKRNETSVLVGDKMAEIAGCSKADGFENIASTSSFNVSNGSNVIEIKE